MTETFKQWLQNYRETTRYSHCKYSVFKAVLRCKTNPVQGKGWEKTCPACSQDHQPASWQAGGPGLVYALHLIQAPGFQ